MDDSLLEKVSGCCSIKNGTGLHSDLGCAQITGSPPRPFDVLRLMGHCRKSRHFFEDLLSRFSKVGQLFEKLFRENKQKKGSRINVEFRQGICPRRAHAILRVQQGKFSKLGHIVKF